MECAHLVDNDARKRSEANFPGKTYPAPATNSGCPGLNMIGPTEFPDGIGCGALSPFLTQPVNQI